MSPDVPSFIVQIPDDATDVITHVAGEVNACQLCDREILVAALLARGTIVRTWHRPGGGRGSSGLGTWSGIIADLPVDACCFDPLEIPDGPPA